MDIDRSDMIGFSLPPVVAVSPDPVHELHLKFVTERERVPTGGSPAAKQQPVRRPAKWDGKEREVFESTYWQRMDFDRHGKRRRK